MYFVSFFPGYGPTVACILPVVVRNNTFLSGFGSGTAITFAVGEEDLSASSCVHSFPKISHPLRGFQSRSGCHGKSLSGFDPRRLSVACRWVTGMQLVSLFPPTDKLYHNFLFCMTG